MRRVKFVVFLFLLLSGSRSAFAADLEVSCVNQGPCSLDPSGGALFNESNIAPGESFVKTLQATNYDENDDCNLKARVKNASQLPGTFAARLFTVAREGPTALYGGLVNLSTANSDKSFSDLVNGEIVDLGILTPNGGQNIYSWVATFDSAAGNEFQNANLNFDLDLTFTCDHEEGGGDDGDGDEGEKEGEGGETAGLSTFFGFSGFAPPETVEESTDAPEKVIGIRDVLDTFVEDVCTNPWWWFLTFFVQLILQVVLLKTFSDSPVKGLAYFVQLLVGAGFVYIFWNNSCPSWDVYISAVLTLLMLLITWRESTKQ